MSLRRSQRGRRPKYNVGDVVEILDSSVAGTSMGQLLHRVKESKPDNVRWLVTFDDDYRPDEEVSEKSFGRLVHSVIQNNEKEATAAANKPVVASRGSSSQQQQPSPTATSSGSSEADEQATAEGKVSCRGVKRKKEPDALPATAIETISGPTDDNQTGHVKRNSIDGSMEPRIATRSTAKNDPTGINGGLDNKRNGSRKAKKLGSTPRAAAGRGSSGVGSMRGGKLPRKTDEEVVKVKMLTGILYLYRGANQRAEFVRFY